MHEGATTEDSGNKDKGRSECEKKRRDDTNVLLSKIETLVYTSKLASMPYKKVGKIQILDKTCSFIRFYKKLVQGSDVSDSFIPSSVLQDLFIYSQRGFLVVVDTSGQVVCCSSSTMGFLQTQDTEIVGTKLSSILSSTDSDYILSLINQRKDETKPFLVHFTMNSPHILRTFICRAFWHQFSTLTEPHTESSREFGDETGALILACSSIDKLSIYNLPIFCSDKTLSFEFKVSLDGKFTKSNDAMERYTGYSSADLLGHCLLDYVNWEQTEELMATMSETLREGTSATCCLQFCCKSKSWIWIQANLRVSQNVWNSRIDSLIFNCRVLEYNDVIQFFAQVGVPPQTLFPSPASDPLSDTLPSATVTT